MDNGNPYIMSIVGQLGLIFTSLFTLIGVIVQVRSSNKQKKNDDLVKSIDSKLDDMKKDSDKADKDLRDCVEKHHLRYFKDQLVTTMSRIQSGYVPTAEEKFILAEQKDAYNALGGDSYVDGMWDNLKSRNLL